MDHFSENFRHGPGEVHELVRGRFVNRPLFWDDWVGRLWKDLSQSKKSNKHKHFGQDGVWDKRDPSHRAHLWGKPRSSPGQTGHILLNRAVNLPVCLVCPWDRWGSFLGQLSREVRRKNVYVFRVRKKCL